MTVREAFWLWVKVALFSFGGPTGQIAVMHRLLVEERRWVSENRFLHALNYCMLLPGPEAQQLATYIGWLMHGLRGGLMAGILFVLPGFWSILILSILYAGFQEVLFVQALFFGLKPAVVAVVAEAVPRIGRRALRNRMLVALAALAFVAIFMFHVSFPLIVVFAGLIGFLGGKFRPDLFEILVEKPVSSETQDAGIMETPRLTDRIPTVRPTLRRAALVAALGLLFWFGPLLAVRSMVSNPVFFTQGIFFSKAAVVTFGGAYAVLAYIAREAVLTYGWLKPGEMLDGLGMAETTPGPLIQVVQFVGFMGAYRNPGEMDPMQAGVIGSVVVTWATFAPCFLWIFLGAPYIEYLRGNKSLTTVLTAITAAVVGVILNLAVFFAVHTLFGAVDEVTAYGMRLLVPDPATLDPAVLVITVAALLLMVRFRVGMIKTLLLCTAAGLLFFLLFRA